MKNILLVGAGKGIGLELAKILSQENKVFAITRSKSEELEKTKAEITVLDVVKDDLEKISLPDVLDGLVYCPGTINLKPFARLKEEDFLDDFQKNVLGAVKIIQKCSPNLKKSESGSIVLFSTVAVKMGMPFHSSVAASKAAVEGLTKSLAAEFSASKIRVNAIAPSLIDTSLGESLLNSDKKREAADKRHPLQRIGKPEEIAEMAAFLLSEKAAWLTGQIIGLDGGMGSLKV